MSKFILFRYRVNLQNWNTMKMGIAFGPHYTPAHTANVASYQFVGIMCWDFIKFIHYTKTAVNISIIYRCEFENIILKYVCPKYFMFWPGWPRRNTDEDAKSSFTRIIMDDKLLMTECVAKLYRKVTLKARIILSCWRFYSFGDMFLLQKAHVHWIVHRCYILRSTAQPCVV